VNKSKNVWTTLLLSLSLLMAGCGGGDDNESAADDAADTNQLSALSGKSRDSTRTPSTKPTRPPKNSTVAPTTERAPLGVNVEGLWDWARLQPFVDLMKSSRPWGSVDAPWDEAAAKDADGWPTTDAGVVVNVRTMEPGDEAKSYRYVAPGTYRLRFTGRATVTANSSPGVAIANYAYDAAANKSQADVVVGPGAEQLMLSFRNTAGGVKHVTLRSTAYPEGQTFSNEFVRALAPFQVVRFMDFLRTNNNPARTWGERTTPASATQVGVKGAAFEYAVQVANEMGKDIWVNIPMHADEAYVRSLAQLLNASLAPGRAVYVEYSNELWNFQFTQSKQNVDAAVAEAIAGDTTLTNGQACTQAMFDAMSGECNPYWAGYYRVGKQTLRVAQVFSEVFGAAAMNSRVRVVYATQFANPGIAEQVLKNIARFRAAPSSLLYGVATAPYFYLPHELVGSESGTVDQILQGLGASLAKDTEPYFASGTMSGGTFVRGSYTGGNYTGASHKALADYYGLKSLAYEGGPDFGQNEANRAAKVAANRDSRMGALLKSQLTQWYGCGNDLFMYFSLSSAWDRYGYWGLTNDGGDLASVKYTAVREIAESARATHTTCR
jgi:hypothetical protein